MQEVGTFKTTITTFDHFKQRMVSQGILTNTHLPCAFDSIAFGDIARLQMVNLDFRKGLRLESASPGLDASYRVPATFWHRNQSPQGLEALPPKELNRAGNLSQGLRAGMVATSVKVNNDASRQSECRVV